MKRLTVKQYAGMINKMSAEGLLYYVAGAIKESRDIWRCPANMKLLCDAAQQAAKHYIKLGGEKDGGKIPLDKSVLRAYNSP